LYKENTEIPMRKDTKKKIAKVAWQLFREKGYEQTTVDDIILRSGTSKGSFYNYYTSKDELLSGLSDVFDAWYEEIYPTIDPDMNSFDKLIFLCTNVHRKIEQEIPLELLSYLYSSQVKTKGNKHLLNTNRFYYKVVDLLIAEGQSRGQISTVETKQDIAKLYALCERAIIYDYCISEGRYALGDYTAKTMPKIFSSARGEA